MANNVKNPQIPSRNLYKDILRKSYSVPYSCTFDNISDRLEAIRKGLEIFSEDVLLNRFLQDKTDFSSKSKEILETCLEFYREIALKGSLRWKISRWILSTPNTDVDEHVKQLSYALQLKIHNIFKRHIKNEKMRILNELFNNGLLHLVSIDVVNILSKFEKSVENMVPRFPDPLTSLDWSIKEDLDELNNILQQVTKGAKSIVSNHSNSEKEHAKVLKLIRSQQSQIQILEKQLQGRDRSGPFSCGLSYRKPNSNFNILASILRGRGTLNISCVPDESAPLLGPHGFVNGVGPGNLGISFTINV